MINKEIRDRAKQSGVSLWQIACELGISEPTMTRKLRFELEPEDKAHVRRIIEKLSEKKQ